MKKWKRTVLVAFLLTVPMVLCDAATAQSEYSAAAIEFSQPGGLYEEAFTLTLQTEADGAVIRYTLDGSDPTADAQAYTTGIAIEDRTEEENNLSAIVVSGGGFGGRGMPEIEARGGRGGGQGGDAGRQQPQEGAQEQPAQQRGARGGGMFGGESSTPPEENVFKGTTVKAALFDESGTQLSDVAVQSYFVADDIFARYGNLAVVSIVTDADNFYDEDTGIFTNANQSGADWERPVHVEMYEPDGTLAFSQYMGARVNGNSTRNYAQKSLRLYAKASYDEENPTVEYEIFDDLLDGTGEDTLTTFKRILLRNSGNDNGNTQFRDALVQSLAEGLNVDTQAARACVVFINGEFWGLYNIRERYDDHYFANVYGFDAAEVAVLEISNSSSTAEVSEGEASDLDYYEEMWNFFNDNDISNPENYEKAQTYIDLDNFIDYYIVNIYSGNTDWPANNNVFWRYRTENGGYDPDAEWYMDGRYRWVLKDMDFGFGQTGQASSDTLAHAMSEEEGRGGFGGRGADGEQMPAWPGGEGEMPQMPQGMPDMGQAGGVNGFAPPEGVDIVFPFGGADGQGDAAFNEEDMQRFVEEMMGEEGGMGGGFGFTNASSTLIFRKLLENEDFLHRFVNRFCDVMNTNYDADYVVDQIRAFQDERAEAIEEHIARYPGSLSDADAWEQNIQRMVDYATERAGYVRGFLAQTFDLGDIVQVSLATDAQGGYIRINDTDIREGTPGVTDTSSWQGSYFAGTTQTLAAVPQAGYSFVKFVVTDTATGDVREYTEQTIDVTLGSEGTQIEAVFTAA